MKNLILLISIIAALGFSACEKVIHPDLSNGKTLVVIQGRISTDSVQWKVRVTLTQDYFSTSEPPVAEGALVTIVDNLGNTDTLFQEFNGYFLSKEAKKCEVGRTYTLRVVYQGKVYSATETCLPQEPIDSLTYEFRKKSGFIPAGYYITEHAKENAGAGDHYLWEIYRNDTLIDDFGYFLNDDAFVNGNYISADFPFPFSLNDSVRVDQLAISKQWYSYLTSVQTEANKSGTPFDTPPANPVSNIQGGVGYFAVVNLQRKALRIQ